MYAVVESGNKQYRIELGSEIQVDRLEAQPGDSIRLDRVLLIADGDETTIGRPIVEGATVSADVLRQERGEKIVVFKYKPKARTRVKKGFRAELTTLRISEIALGGRSAAKDAQQSQVEHEMAAKEAERSAAAKAAADIELAAKLAAAATDASGAEPADATASKTAKPRAAKPRAAAPKPSGGKATGTSKKVTAKATAAETPADEPVAQTEGSAEADTAEVADDTKKDE